MKKERTCGLCGDPYPGENLYPFDGLELCAHCLDERTLLCRHCRERIWEEDNAGSSEVPICQSCYDDHDTNCCRCGTLLHESKAYYSEDDNYDESPYCSDCFHTLSDASPIHDYYYNPRPVFHGTGPRFFGVKLEIDGAGKLKEHARSLMEVGNQKGEYLYIKHDGFLEDGLELVTQPANLDYQLHYVSWAKLFSQTVWKDRKEAAAPLTCGMIQNCMAQKENQSGQIRDGLQARLNRLAQKREGLGDISREKFLWDNQELGKAETRLQE